MGHRPGHHGRDHHARRAEHETEVFEEPGQAVQNAQAGATLEKSDVEKVATPERIRSDLLDDLLGRIQELPDDQRLLFICAQGVRSGLACEMAAAMGLDSGKLYNIEDGTPAWIEKGLPSNYGADA